MAKAAPKNLLKGLKRPKSAEFQHVETRPDYGKFVAEPFEKGFGVTIANSLRRVLMSYIEGAAIVAVKIEGVSHEFSTMPGIKEDVTRLILNLKRVRLKMEGQGPLTLEVEKKGAGVLMAGDFAVSNSVEIMNPDLVLAHMNEDANLKMTLQIDKGRGYLPAEITKKMIDEVGVIPIDALFSPITKVNFDITETRVDQRTDYDKVTFEIWTDMTISPEDAMAYAAKILKEHLTVFINFAEEMYEEEEFDETDERLKKAMQVALEDMEMSVRSIAVLRSLDMRNVKDIVTRYEDDLRKSKHYSDKVLLQLKSKLANMNLAFGMRDGR
ncbi:DNA-directed RNA polymerase subunit alpha [Turneriella parva]|uniref:DNA-directed RNA polymerase subunit alpha n=1 Tax=Turneriella parva (strain ATCC BAA-1111 / DSM 21527 / NCTC 11395 / H) TaxID=869212 RepID=I4B7F9_TURPD|nr:DNA-directed RNA polymerase subunit alpha [Turneriella parva]AFM13216.1 DNA-directed RNA polymerase subunit alpha [Turneriella parva DSM 21527]